MKKIIKKYNEWIKTNAIYKEWKSDDYENTIVYESIDGNIISIMRDEDNNIIDAWKD